MNTCWFFPQTFSLFRTLNVFSIFKIVYVRNFRFGITKVSLGISLWNICTSLNIIYTSRNAQQACKV